MNSNATISSSGIFVLHCFIEETWCRSLSCVCAYAFVCAQSHIHLCVHKAMYVFEPLCGYREEEGKC